MFMDYLPALNSNGKIDALQGSAASGANNLFSHTGNANPQIKTDYNDSPFTGSPSGNGSVNYFYNTDHQLEYQMIIATLF
jgi:hypothetical protein